MRLFGTPGGSLDRARSTYWFCPPFDLAFAAAPVGENTGSPPVSWDMQQYDQSHGALNPGIPNWSTATRPKLVKGKIKQLEGIISLSLSIQGQLGPFAYQTLDNDPDLSPGSPQMQDDMVGADKGATNFGIRGTTSDTNNSIKGSTEN